MSALLPCCSTPDLGRRRSLLRRFPALAAPTPAISSINPSPSRNPTTRTLSRTTRVPARGLLRPLPQLPPHLHLGAMQSPLHLLHAG